MRRFLIRLAIALVAFSAGVAVATIFNGIFGSSPAKPRHHYSRPYESPQRHPCPNSTRVLSAVPSFEPAETKRVTIKLADGTVRVIDSRVEKKPVK